MMKKIYLLIVILSGISFSSCSDYLNVDKYFADRMNEQKLFENKDYTNRWLAGVYSHLVVCQDVGSKRSVLTNFSDDMYYTDDYAGCSYRTFKYGMYNEGFNQQHWQECYVGIRDATTFLRCVDINKELSYEEIQDYKAQARFLRAYYYWYLLRRYGPIPLIKEELDYTAEYEKLAIPRSSYDECVEYIVNELVLAAKDLPLKRTARAITRPTRGAALGLRAKVLLYAASPYVNGNTEMAELQDMNGRMLISQEYDERKWAKAAAAAKDVIDLNAYELNTSPRRKIQAGIGYPITVEPPHNEEFSDKNWPEGWADIDPFESYRSLFNGDVQLSSNTEMIFTRGQNQDGENIEAMVLHQMPLKTKGVSCHGMTQKQCDAYYMDDGTDIPGMHDYMPADYPDRNTLPRQKGFVDDGTTQFELHRPLENGVSLQYANREPRFYASVGYNGSIWEQSTSKEEIDRNYQCWYYNGDLEGINIDNKTTWLRTGIGIKKFYNPQDSYQTEGKRIGKADLAMRYAEILLIYAEALNELISSYDIPSWNGEKTYTIMRDQTEMKNAIKPIRIRAGLPNYKQEVYDDAKLFRKSLKRERQIELFAEGHRYYDLRRWKDAPREEATPVYGCNMYLDREMRNEFYIPTVVASMPAVFIKKMYFWPISHGELKRNSQLTQNPGWTYYD